MSKKLDTSVVTPKVNENVDAFGSRKGSNAAKINAALTIKPQTMKELMEKAGLEGNTFFDHLNRLVEKGLVVKPEKGRYGLPIAGTTGARQKLRKPAAKKPSADGTTATKKVVVKKKPATSKTPEPSAN